MGNCPKRIEHENLRIERTEAACALATLYSLNKPRDHRQQMQPTRPGNADSIFHQLPQQQLRVVLVIEAPIKEALEHRDYSLRGRFAGLLDITIETGREPIEHARVKLLLASEVMNDRGARHADIGSNLAKTGAREAKLRKPAFGRDQTAFGCIAAVFRSSGPSERHHHTKLNKRLIYIGRNKMSQGDIHDLARHPGCEQCQHAGFEAEPLFDPHKAAALTDVSTAPMKTATQAHDSSHWIVELPMP